MIQEKIVNNINTILDEWDPIGVNSSDENITCGEYSMYIKKAIEIYLSNQSMYDFLIKLHTDLIDLPDDKLKSEIKIVSDKLISLLSEYKSEELKSIFKK